MKEELLKDVIFMAFNFGYLKGVDDYATPDDKPITIRFADMRKGAEKVMPQILKAIKAGEVPHFEFEGAEECQE